MRSYAYHIILHNLKVVCNEKNDSGLYRSLVLVMSIGMCNLVIFCLHGLASMAAFDKLQFYIIKCNKENKNTRICVEMYGEACTQFQCHWPTSSYLLGIF